MDPLRTRRLVLRPLCIDDAEAIHRYRSDPAVARFQTWGSRGVEEIRDFIEEQSAIDVGVPGTWYQLALCPVEGGPAIGDCGLRFPADKNAEVEFGITLDPEHQGLGLARETLTAVFDLLFHRLGKHRIIGIADARNAPSIRLMQRLGMRREAYHRASTWTDEGWTDDVVYAILREEWGRNETLASGNSAPMP
jgi:RimJ/RimL family protein N-acetyltransferase